MLIKIIAKDMPTPPQKHKFGIRPIIVALTYSSD